MILLASRSPQRQWLLRRAGLAFRVITANVDEDAVLAPSPRALALARARAKAHATAEEGIVLGADTVVAHDHRVYGSPATHAEARATLGALSGTTHDVITAHCLCRFRSGRSAEEATAVECARVTMRALAQEEIARYVASGESDGRAGAYAIQETGDSFVERIDGDWDTIVGLHVDAVRALWAALVGGSPPSA